MTFKRFKSYLLLPEKLRDEYYKYDGMHVFISKIALKNDSLLQQENYSKGFTNFSKCIIYNAQIYPRDTYSEIYELILVAFSSSRIGAIINP